MLTESDFKLIEKQAVKLYGDLELEIIQEIAERIANVGYANTVVYNNTVILQEMGVLYQDIISMVAKYNEKTKGEILKIFEDAGIKTISRDDMIYKEAGLNPVPLKRSRSLMQLMSAEAERTHYNLSNLVQTTAGTSQMRFIEAMNKSYMEVSTGVKSYSQAIVDTVKDISKNGAYVQYPSGQRRSIEVATRMNIITSVNQTCGKMQELRAQDMNWDLMELSAHGGARPEHAEWQGKIVSRSGQAGYLSLDDIGYGTATGFQGVNCRHTWFPYYKSSTRTYTNNELRELNNKKVNYNGQEMSEYQATQVQRYMERKIRQNKKDIAGLQGLLTGNSDIDVEETQRQLREIRNNMRINNATLNDFLEQTGFRKDSTRLMIGNIQQINNKSNEVNFIEKNVYLVNKQTKKVIEQNFFIDDNNNKYIIDGKNVKIKANEAERKIAKVVGNYLDKDVKLVPVVLNPKGIKTPDYMIGNDKYDLKKIYGNGKNTIDTAISKQKKQSTNFIFDISDTQMEEEEAIQQIKRIYNSKHRQWVKTIILMKNDKVLKIYERK